ncbi:hypothetical protein NQ176_g8660 [Zarea fungicola]|uniref:Uncharacterized protein n=1 Tax=Zarea fungicola TaxID=93591 RepID=A0ACC1MSF7_9HYPO|nr:hypothetical protein NQ176_g8660 [Lecanicillium fungicola]
MKLTHSFLVAAATFNLAIGAPFAEEKSRAVVAEDAVKRATANNPYFVHNINVEREPMPGSATPGRVRSVLNMIGKRKSGHQSKRYQYVDTPRPKSVENLDKRYQYVDTPRLKSVEDVSKRYQYVDTPRPKSVEDLSKRD